MDSIRNKRTLIFGGVLERLPHQAAAQMLDVDLDVRKLGHDSETTKCSSWSRASVSGNPA